MIRLMCILMIFPIWHNVFFYLFVGLAVLTMVVALIISKKITKKNLEIKLVQQQQIAKIDNIRKEHSDTLEKLRQEMLRREEERTRQWIESERETLHVLNGVSILLDLGEKLGKVDSEKILKKLDEIQTKVEKLTVN